MPNKKIGSTGTLIDLLFGEKPERIVQHQQGHAASTFEVSVCGKDLIVKLYDDLNLAKWLNVVSEKMKRVRSAGVPVPRIINTGSGTIPYSYLVYEKVKGIPASEFTRNRGPIWEQLGRYIAVVNSLPADGYSMVVNGNSGNVDNCTTWKSLIGPVLEQLDRPGLVDDYPIFQKFLPYLKNRLEALPEWRFDPVVIHGNISNANVIVDLHSGEIKSLIDWDSMLFARAPHFELATALLWQNEQEKSGFLRGYGLSEAAYRSIKREIETVRLLYLSRYLKWHIIHDNHGLIRTIQDEMEAIIYAESPGKTMYF